MHSAPTVSYPLGRSHFQGWLGGLTSVAGIAIGVLWYCQADLIGWRQLLFFLTLLLTSGFAAVAWRRSPEGCLRWDGTAWGWTAGSTAESGVLSVHLDLQFCLVLSLRTDTGARIWFWPERRVDLAHWNDLRRAVFVRSGTGNAQDASIDAQQAAR